jgi:hypothetical protein
MHPFHRLRGERLAVLFVKRRGTDVVLVCAGAVGGQVTLPHAWTDRSEPALAHRLSLQGLADLAAVTRTIEGC